MYNIILFLREPCPLPTTMGCFRWLWAKPEDQGHCAKPFGSQCALILASFLVVFVGTTMTTVPLAVLLQESSARHQPLAPLGRECFSYRFHNETTYWTAGSCAQLAAAEALSSSVQLHVAAKMASNLDSSPRLCPGFQTCPHRPRGQRPSRTMRPLSLKLDIALTPSDRFI